MKNNKVRPLKRAPNAANKSKVYTQKKPATKKAKLTLKETVVPTDTYTTQNNSKTTYISVDADTLGKYPVVNTEPSNTIVAYTDKDANGSVNLSDAYNKYSKVVEEENSEDTKRSELLPSNNDDTRMIVVLVGIAAFAALLLLLI